MNMKRLAVLVAFAALCLSSCNDTVQDKVMARHVPERMDDFVWENDLIAGRAYGKALEGNPLSPGFDIWVKMPGELVADNWYAEAQKDPDYYHRDHGGKDCYKVAKSLGGGASVPMADGKFIYPATNWRDYKVIEDTDTKVVFELKYPAWDVDGVQVSLTKRFTLEAGSYFCKVEDFYEGEFETLSVAAGFWKHDPANVNDYYVSESALAIWESASDQSIEPETGMLGIAVVMSDPDQVMYEGPEGHAVLVRNIVPGDIVTYHFGSCWSKADIKTSQQWFETVAAVR